MDKAYKIVQAFCQQVTFNGTTSTASTDTLKYSDVVLYATEDCYVAFGVSAPAATKTGNGNIFIPAGTFFELVTYPGDYVACIGAIGAGNLIVYPVTN